MLAGLTGPVVTAARYDRSACEATPQNGAVAGGDGVQALCVQVAEGAFGFGVAISLRVGDYITSSPGTRVVVVEATHAGVDEGVSCGLRGRPSLTEKRDRDQQFPDHDRVHGSALPDAIVDQEYVTDGLRDSEHDHACQRQQSEPDQGISCTCA